MDIIAYHTKRETAIKNEKLDPYRYGQELDHWHKMDGLLQDVDTVLVMGGNRCLAPEQPIYNPVTESYTPISEIYYETTVLAWDGSRLVPAKASKPFQKKKDRIYRVTLEDGASFSCSGEHRVLLANGEYSQIQDVECGVFLFQPESISDISPSEYPVDEQSYSGKPLSSQDYCSAYPHLCDGQPHWLTDNEIASLPLQDDAQEYILCASFGSDDLGYIPQYNHPYSLSSLLSSLDDLRQSVGQSFDTLYHVSCKLYKSTLQSLSNLKTKLVHLLPFVESNHSQSTHESDQQDNQYIFSSFDNRGGVRVVKVDYLRDDYVWDLTVPEYENYWCEGVIHHNSGKSEVCGKRVVQAAVNNPNSVIWCFQTTFENSVQMQQKIIWKYIPLEMKSMKRSQVTYISYSQKRGFSDAKLVFPNGSEIVFRNYSQDISTIEGGEVGSMRPMQGKSDIHNIGIWADELIPQNFLETLRYRLVTRNAKMLISFTAVEGYSPVVKEFMNGARTEESVEADLIKGMKVPIIQQPKRRDSKIIYFHTKDNPYGGYDRIAKTLEGAHREDILCRAYGVPSKPMAGKFPKYSDQYNIIKHEEIPFIKDKDQSVTHYMCIDPAGSKPYFMMWVGVTEMDEVYVWAEYADVSFGDWADMSKGKRGRFGDAAKPNGFGYLDYKDIIDGVEEGVSIFERIIDSRAGATKFQKEEAQTCTIDELSNIGIEVIPASGLPEDQRIQAINKYLAWDDRKPMDIGNKPRLFISDRCGQLIYALTEYTGMLGKDEPTKDPIDCLGYLLIGNIMNVDEGESHLLRTTRR
jgi:hypothetical protein